MANWNVLKAAVAEVINSNGNQEITGQLLQNVLNNIITNVGENATFAGIATLNTSPGAPDGPVFYLTATTGVYPNFNGLEVSDGEATIFLWNNSTWTKKVTGFATQEKLSQLGSEAFGLYKNKGQYITLNGGYISPTSGTNAITDYLSLDGVNRIVVKGRSGSAVALYAFYDKDKKLINTFGGAEYDKRIVEIDTIPTNAAYFIANGYGDGTDILYGFNVDLLLRRADNALSRFDNVYMSAASEKTCIKINTKDKTVTIPSGMTFYRVGVATWTVSSDINVDTSIASYVYFLLVNVKEKTIKAVTTPNITQDDLNNYSVAAVINNGSSEILQMNSRMCIFNGDVMHFYNKPNLLDISISSFKRAYVTGRPIQFNTLNKNITIPGSSKLAIASDGFNSVSPISGDDVVIDTSNYSYSFLLLYNPDNKSFTANALNDMTQETKKCWLVAVVNNGSNVVTHIIANEYAINGVIHRPYMSEGWVNDKINESYHALNGDWYVNKLKYIDTNGNILNTPNSNAITDYLDIEDVETIQIKGRSTNLVSLYAFYDKNKNFISGLYGTEYADTLITLTKDNIPSTAKYIIVNGYNEIEKNYLNFTSLFSLYSKIQKNNSTGSSSIDTLGEVSGVGTMGASLMFDGNGWVESGCELVGTESYNKAESGVGVPSYFANKIWRETYCSDLEFESMDVLAIQFASSGDVYTLTEDKSIEDYEEGLDISSDVNPFTSFTYAECLDYILKKWQKRCYEQKDNAESKWYGTQHGKPCRLMFVTHWHDGRTAYNESIRRVAEKWGGGICEFDKKIGFSKNQKLPNGSQVSIIYAVDTEIINGETFGWHPLRGASSSYIQGKMANIFANSLKEYFSQK